MKHEQEKKWSVNELWDKFNLITTKFFFIALQASNKQMVTNMVPLNSQTE